MSTPDLFARAQGRVSEVSRRAVEQVAREIDFYGELPREILEGELTDYMMANVRLYLRLLRDGRLPTDEEISGPVSAGIRRAQEGVPFAAMISAYLAGTRAALEELQEMATPAEQEELILAGHHALRYLGHVLPMLSTVYLEEYRALYGEEQDLRRTLVAALIAGEPADDLAARARVSVADSYTVLALTLRGGAVAEVPGTTADVAGRRLVRTVHEIVAEHLGARALTALEPRGGLVLAPSREVAAEPEKVAAEVATALTERLGATPYVGLVTHAAPGEIPASAEQATEVARLARVLGRPPGVHVLDEMLTEYQLTRPGPARDRLVARLHPLDGHPHLREALESFLACDHNSKLAAERLHVHTNTLHYRLRRIAELTALDPARPAHLRVLAGALVAERASVAD